MNGDLIIKILFVNIYIYTIYCKIIDYKEINYLKIIIVSVLTSILYIFMRKLTDTIFSIVILYFLQIIFLKFIIEERNSLFWISNLIANVIEYMTFTVAMLIEYAVGFICRINSSTINFLLIVIINALLLIAFFKIKRFKNGISFLKKKKNSEYTDIIIINIATIIIFVYCLFGSYNIEITKHIFIPFVLLAVNMIIMIQRTFTLYYKQKLLNKTIEEYKSNIQQKDNEIKKISEEKFKISKLNHEFYNRQKSLELKVAEMINNTNFNMETSSEISVIKQINNLTREYSKDLEKIKSPDKLPLTEIEEIDDMFKYMQSECNKNKIEFKLKINGNIQHMINKIIPQNKLVTLIGDHIKDAIIAVNSSNNNFKSIIAILGVRNGYYEFCVYDTGIEFEIDTLLKLGIEPVTTHKDIGGTGIGFITTFETLESTKGSLIIEEKNKMADSDYTKAVIIRFDNKNEYKICSYRAEEIKRKAKDNRIIIESN